MEIFYEFWGVINFICAMLKQLKILAKVDHIVFDKTGTLTTGDYMDIEYVGRLLTPENKQKIATLAAQSIHPLSKAIAAFLGRRKKTRGSRFY